MEKKEKLIQENKYKISFMSFVSMIFLTVYGIANPQQIYYQMGYSSITYLIIAAIVYFIPYCFIIAEMSSAFKDRKGGIFSWMAESVSEKFGFIGTLIWYGSFVVMWFSASTICISISVVIFGKDTTSTWNLFGLSSPEILAIIGVIYMVVMGIVSTRGIKKMTFLSNIAIATVIIAHILILGSAFIVFGLSGGHFAQGFDFHKVSSYFYGPNKDYSGVIAAIGFLVFVIFSYGGMENMGGMVDKVKNAKKNVPKAIMLSCLVITVLYIAIVLITGMVCNWKATFGSPNVNLANFSIYILQQQFYRLGTAFGMNTANAILLGQWVNRLLTLLTLVGLVSMPLRLYSPIKHMFEGLPKGIIPEKLTKINKHGVAGNAVIFQTIIVVFFVLLLGFGGGSVSALFNKITLMTFVAGTVPYSFIVFAYIKFKKNNKIKKEYEFFSKKVGITVGIISFIIITFVNIYAIIEPSLQGSIVNTLWIGGGPVIFVVLGLILYGRYERKQKLGLIKTHESILEDDDDDDLEIL
ncbi:MAG: glutamate/gamma-aminobutyrate family transporter YjeM [Sarcina sp.]